MFKAKKVNDVCILLYLPYYFESEAFFELALESTNIGSDFILLRNNCFP